MGRVPLDDISGLIASAHGITYSNSLLVALAERCVPLVICGANHHPVGFLWTADGHHEQAGRMSDQLSASKPIRKRMWSEIVRAKIKLQGSAIKDIGKSNARFDELAKRVRSGDPNNCEAQAARHYWPILLGPAFRRNRLASGANSLLNYGYTILRSASARAVMASGLHPSVGIAHRQRGNSFALADDVMEPFRPVVDILVHDLVQRGDTKLYRDTKAYLAKVLTLDMRTTDGFSPVSVCMNRLVYSMTRFFAGETRSLDLPLAIPKIALPFNH